MQVCAELQERIDKIWRKLEKRVHREGMSQIELDTACVDAFEKLVDLTPEKMIDVFSRQKFTDWHSGEDGNFGKWFGDPARVSKKQVVKDVIRFFDLPS